MSELLQRKYDTINAGAKFDEMIFEMSDIPREAPFVGGAMSALGNAQSFHNPFCVQLRQDLHKSLKHLFSTDSRFACEITPNFELLIYRIGYRPRGVKPQRESWHRDTSPEAAATDVIFGGWINFNSDKSEIQYFSCVPHSQHYTKGEVGAPASRKVSYGDLAVAQAGKTVITVPPGTLLLFYQDILHEICAKKLPFDMKRVYVGARLTACMQPLHSALFDLLRTNQVIPVKSAQVPRLYPKLWVCNHFSLLQTMSARFPREYTIEAQALPPATKKKRGRQLEEGLVPAVAKRTSRSSEKFIEYTDEMLTQYYGPSPFALESLSTEVTDNITS